MVCQAMMSQFNSMEGKYTRSLRFHQNAEYKAYANWKRCTGICHLKKKFYLVKEFHVDFSLCFPRLLIWGWMRRRRRRRISLLWLLLFYGASFQVSRGFLCIRAEWRTCHVLLKDDFGSLQKVLSNDEDFVSTTRGAAVQTLLQNLRQTSRLGCQHEEERWREGGEWAWSFFRFTDTCLHLLIPCPQSWFIDQF